MTQAHPPRAKKSLGQHFLGDKNICRKIVDLLQITSGDNVIEIGPGPGALSDLLMESAANRLVLLEKDKYWAGERQKVAPPKAQTVLTDALTMAWERITPDNPWKIIGNLPYNVASLLMWDIFSQATGLTRAVFMVQREVGDRLVAVPGNKTYGALSVWVQSFVAPRMVMVVGPQSFNPPPKVDSAVLIFSPLPEGQRPQHPRILAKLIKICLQNRRKQLGSIFRQHHVPAWEHACYVNGIAHDRRPETLSPTDFQQIAAFFAGNRLDFDG